MLWLGSISRRSASLLFSLLFIGIESAASEQYASSSLAFHPALPPTRANEVHRMRVGALQSNNVVLDELGDVPLTERKIHSRCIQSTTTRRSIVKKILDTGCVAASALCCYSMLPNFALATTDTAEVTISRKSASRKPYAPLENLLPATRVKVYIDRAVDKAEALAQLEKKDDMSSNIDGGKTREQLITDLTQLFRNPPAFMTTEEASKSKKYLEQPTLDSWTKKRQQETQRSYDIKVDPATQANEAFEQWGERRQFKRLRRQQLALERANEMRAAFNTYTNNLIFGDSYTLNASPKEKSRLIRTYDQLPDVTSVVRSDLDLRDLYRNQVLTSMDDAKAELEYQLKSAEQFDGKELLTLLKEAQRSCSEWFEFVPENDLKDALVALNADNI